MSENDEPALPLTLKKIKNSKLFNKKYPETNSNFQNKANFLKERFLCKRKFKLYQLKQHRSIMPYNTVFFVEKMKEKVQCDALTFGLLLNNLKNKGLE